MSKICKCCGAKTGNNTIVYDGYSRFYYLCQNCASRHLKQGSIEKCHCCQKYYMCHSLYNIDGYSYCTECKRQLTKSCECGNLILGGKYCVECAKHKFINQYSYKPKANFYSYPNEEEKLFAGIELEMNFDDVIDFKKFIEHYSADDFVYLKRDGSIGNNGVEIVSHPATFKFHFHNSEWKTIFSQFKHTNTLGCGLHIHLSKNAFNREEVAFLDYLVNNFDYMITQIGSRSLTHYCRKIKARRWGYDRLSNHTDACNLTNDKTIELRFCKSTNNYRSFMKKLKNIWVLVMFVKFIGKYKKCREYMTEDKKKEVERYFNYFKGELLSRI
jgi:hypothetical protein